MGTLSAVTRHVTRHFRTALAASPPAPSCLSQFASRRRTEGVHLLPAAEGAAWRAHARLEAQPSLLGASSEATNLPPASAKRPRLGSAEAFRPLLPLATNETIIS